MEISLIILSVALFLNIIFILRLHKVNSMLKSENDKLKSEVEKSKQDKQELISIDPGDRAIIPNYGMIQTDTKESFHVTYEVVINTSNIGFKLFTIRNICRFYFQKEIIVKYFRVKKSFGLISPIDFRVFNIH